MPAIFNDETRKKIKLALLNNGFEFIKKYGMKKTSIDEIVKSVGIAKGTFYNFFKSKEDFVLQILEYRRSLVQVEFTKRLNAKGFLDKKDIHDFLITLAYGDFNIYGYLTDEDLSRLYSSFPERIKPSMEVHKAGATQILSLIRDKNPNCNWQVVTNYVKIIVISVINKNKLLEDAFSASIDGLIEMTLDYIFKKEE